MVWALFLITQLINKELHNLALNCWIDPIQPHNAYSYITIFTDKVLIEELLEGFFLYHIRPLGEILRRKSPLASGFNTRGPYLLKSSGVSPKGGHEQEYVVIQLGFHMKAITAMVTIHCLQKLES